MSLISNALLDLWYNATFTGVTFVGFEPNGAAGPFQISLHTASPGTSGANELSDGTYTGVASRQNATFATSSGNSFTTNNAQAFTIAQEATPAITHVGLWGWNGAAWVYLCGAALVTSISNNANVSFASGEITFQIS